MKKNDTFLKKVQFFNAIFLKKYNIYEKSNISEKSTIFFKCMFFVSRVDEALRSIIRFSAHLDVLNQA